MNKIKELIEETKKGCRKRTSSLNYRKKRRYVCGENKISGGIKYCPKCQAKLEGIKLGAKTREEEILKLIDIKIREFDEIAFKHCFKRGKMCEECWERKRGLMEIKQKIEELKE